MKQTYLDEMHALADQVLAADEAAGNPGQWVYDSQTVVLAEYVQDLVKEAQRLRQGLESLLGDEHVNMESDACHAHPESDHYNENSPDCTCGLDERNAAIRALLDGAAIGPTRVYRYSCTKCGLWYEGPTKPDTCPQCAAEWAWAPGYDGERVDGGR